MRKAKIVISENADFDLSEIAGIMKLIKNLFGYF